MAMLVHAKSTKGKKLWYLYGGFDNVRRNKEYPGVRSRSEMYDEVRKELNLPNTVSSKDIVFLLFSKTWIDDKWMDDFSLQLKAHRDRKGWTQVELAEKAGLSIQAISALEQSTRTPSWDSALKLCKALELKLDDFCINVHSMPWSDEQS